ncbi:MAG: type I-C CRISPR-associated protein Cas8c/Csd1 [Planctomycetales bacterium]|nr:type I-C CRISPR-associated protein Cas8c/Csd1 [Planctomycetales bacterium]
MILQALNAYYERLAADPESGVAPFGFSRQNISFSITLNPDGSLHEIEDVRIESDKKTKPRSLVVLGNAKPSGAGINPCFLWDNAAYLLGYKADDPKPDRTRASFDALRERHLAAEQAINDSEFSSVCRFLERWNPNEAGAHEALAELGAGFGVFRLRAADHFVHENPAVQSWWCEQIAAPAEESEQVTGQCLVTGEVGPLARLHEPKIKGVWGGQSSGALLCSVDKSFTAASTLGKLQGFNFPVGENAAFQYCTALNRLLDPANRQRLQVGDTSTVFWTEHPTPAENLLPWVLDPPTGAEDEALKNSIDKTLQAIAQGRYPAEFGEPDTPFYVLGLAPNAARISVRFWWRSTLQELTEHLKVHFADLHIDRSDRDPEFPALWRLLRETVRDSKDLPPLLAGAVMRSVLTGIPYPSFLFSSLVRRIRADREVRYCRAAAIKACLNRNTRFQIAPLEKELPMSLDTTRTEPAYLLGRLFAELEKSQEDALPGINDTIKDRYFGAASATPGSVFPRLVRLNQHHLGKLEKGKKTYRERRIQEIAAGLDEFPTHLSLRDQGVFAIGYYHQRQDLFTKKSNTTSDQETEKE